MALQDAWDPPAEEGLYDIRVGTVCTKKGGYTQSYTPIVTGRVGDKAPVTLAVDMVDAEKRTSSVIATGADIAALVAENKREPHTAVLLVRILLDAQTRVMRPINRACPCVRADINGRPARVDQLGRKQE